MILNNLTGPKPVSTNCESDLSAALLTDVHQLIEEYNLNVDTESKKNPSQQCETYDDVICDPEFKKSELNFLENQSLSVISHSICAKILKQMYCKDCVSNLQTNSELAEHDLIKPMEDLSFPFVKFTKVFKQVFKVAAEIIPTFCSEKNLKKNLIREVKKRIEDDDQQTEEFDTTEIGCVEHNKEIIDKLYEFTTAYSLDVFCKNISHLLTGKIKVLPPEPNAIQELARTFWMKKSRIRKYTDIFKV